MFICRSFSKGISSFLVVVVVISGGYFTCCKVNADNQDQNKKGIKGTHFTLTWDGDAKGGLSNLVAPYTLKSVDINQSGLKLVAKRAKVYLDKVPEGRKAIFIGADLIGQMTWKQENLLWWHKGAKAQGELVGAFFAEFKRQGGKVDILYGDFEGGLTVWHLENAGGGNYGPHVTLPKFDRIINDPRYKTDIRPDLEKRGFIFNTDKTLGNELAYAAYAQYGKTPKDAVKDLYIWNVFSRDWQGQFFHIGLYEPAKKYFPDISYNNYYYSDLDPKYPSIELNGHMENYYGGYMHKVGTHSCPVVYGRLNDIQTKPPIGYPYPKYVRTPFNSLMFDHAQYRPAVLSGSKIQPWVIYRSWTREGTAYGNTDYYNENILHVGLTKPDPFLFFNPHLADWATGDDDLIFSNLLYELDELVGFEDRKTLIKDLQPWDSRYLLTGMEAGGRNVWRITPDLTVPGVTMSSFLVNNSPPKFQIANQIIEFPQGSYIYNPEKEYSSCGYWIISPIGSEPKEYKDDKIPAAPQPQETLGVTAGATSTSKASEEKTEMESLKKARTRLIMPYEPSKVINLTDIRGHWAEESVFVLARAGIIQGDQLQFNPEKEITKADFIVMVSKALGLAPKKYKQLFADITEDMGQADIIQAAIDAKLINEVGNQFQPDKIVTREEMATIMVNAYQYINKSVIDTSYVVISDEAEISSGAVQFVKDAIKLGIIKGLPDGNFVPKGISTRGEAAVVIARLMDLIK